MHMDAAINPHGSMIQKKDYQYNAKRQVSVNMDATINSVTPGIISLPVWVHM